MDAFLSGIMDDNGLSDDLMDDEYYLFADQGTPRRLSCSSLYTIDLCSASYRDMLCLDNACRIRR